MTVVPFRQNALSFELIQDNKVSLNVLKYKVLIRLRHTP